MKIALLAGGVFPSLSKTFIINQITELIELGYEVDIYAAEPDTQNIVHPDVEKYDLWNRIYYDLLPENSLVRLLKSPGILLANFYRDPTIIVRSLNVFKYGKKPYHYDCFIRQYLISANSPTILFIVILVTTV